MNSYTKSQAIIPLQAAKLAGVTVRGFQRQDPQCGAIEALSVTVGGEAKAVYVSVGDEVTVSWAVDGAPSYDPNHHVRFDLQINDDGEFRLEPHGGQFESPVPSEAIWQ